MQLIVVWLLSSGALLLSLPPLVDKETSTTKNSQSQQDSDNRTSWTHRDDRLVKAIAFVPVVELIVDTVKSKGLILLIQL